MLQCFRCTLDESHTAHFSVIFDLLSEECTHDDWALAVTLNREIASLEAVHHGCWNRASEVAQDCLLRTCLCEIKIFPTFFNLLSWHFCLNWVTLILADSCHFAQIQEISYSCPYNNQQYVLSLTKLVRNPVSFHVRVLMVISGLHTVLRLCGKCFSVTVTKYQHDRLLGEKVMLSSWFGRAQSTSTRQRALKPKEQEEKD